MRIFFYGKIGELKAGQGQQAQLDGRDMHRPADAAADAVGNSVLIAVDVDQRRQHKSHTANTTAARRIQRRGEGRFSTPPMLTDQMQRSAPAGLIEEVKDHVGVERNLVAQSLFFILIVGLDK